MNTMLIAQISDMHVKAEGKLLYRRIDTAGFLEAGLRGRDHCLLVGSKDTSGRILSLLGERGFDVEALKTTGRLTQLGGARSTDAMLASFVVALDRAVAAGAPLLRVLGEPAWGDADWPDDESLVAVVLSQDDNLRRPTHSPIREL